MVDFERQRIRSRIEARLLDAAAPQNHEVYGERKSAVIGAMTGTVVELGPGTGPNMRYYGDDVRVIGIEPNPVMHEPLRAKAEASGVDLEIRTLRGEGIDVDDESADGVVATLVLCGVDDPAQVLREIRRVLKPGGTYFFIEHVAAPAGTTIARVQRLAKRPHQWMFNGCRVDSDTESLIRDAGFSSVSVDAVDLGRAGVYVRHQIVGTAVR